MNRAVVQACLFVTLACGCSIGDEPAHAASTPTHLAIRRTATETLHVAGSPERVLEEVPVEPFSLGNGAPETPPVARPDGVPSSNDTQVPETTDPPGPVRVPWAAGESDEADDSTPSPRPQRLDTPASTAVSDNGSTTRPQVTGGNPCCRSPCGVSARSLAALMARPAMTAGAVDPLTTAAGRSAMLAANRPSAALGPSSSGVGVASSRGFLGSGRGLANNRAH
jgi:hypothetical protein